MAAKRSVPAAVPFVMSACVLMPALILMAGCGPARRFLFNGNASSAPAVREGFLANSAHSIKRNRIFSEDFEDRKSVFMPRGSETLSLVSGGAGEGNYCLLAADRRETWNGPSMHVSGMVIPLRRYDVEAWVRCEGRASALQINCGFEINGSSYYTCGFATARAGKWTKLEGTFVFPADTASANLYFESAYSQNPAPEDLADIFIDDIVISEVTVAAADVPPLWGVYADYFSIGAALGAYETRIPAYADTAARHFNSITMGNEMKPDFVLDYGKCSSEPEKYGLSPAIRTDNMDIGLGFARDRGLKLRFHTLVWHEQTPAWFFRERYSADPAAPFASREVMLARMENYIRQTLTYCRENYPGVVYCVDVVNEAIEPDHRDAGNPGGIRSKGNPWYQTVGPDYVEWAFVFARKYAAEGTKLFYNDYNCYNYTKLLAIQNLAADLQGKGLIDGVGMQGHIGMEEPTVMDFQYAVTKLGGTGLEIQITELDINLAGSREEDLAELASRYKRLMTTLRFIKERSLANITNVTVWGLTDDSSWLNGVSGRKYPLLFDKYLRPKAAFFGFALDDSIPLNRIRR